MIHYSKEVKKSAYELYGQGVSYRKIANQLNIKSFRTIYTWAKKYNWAKKDRSHPTESLQKQLDQCTLIVNKIRPKLKKVDLSIPSKDDKELLLNYNRFSNLQLKLVRQLSGIKTPTRTPARKSVFS